MCLIGLRSSKAEMAVMMVMAFLTLFISADDGARQGPKGIDDKSDKDAESRARLRSRIQERRSQTQITYDCVEISYGSDPMQKLDYWRSEAAKAPLIVFLHGGGWKRGDKRNSTGYKPAHYLALGCAFASVNYRLVPTNTVEQQAQDVAMALAFLISRSEPLNFDAGRVVLMGHSAGAHLAALVGTDMRYLKETGLDQESLRGVILLDGACYDVPRQISIGGHLMHETYLQAFGGGRERQIALSPTHQAAAPNAPAFLILHVQRVDGAAQSQALAEALRRGGTAADLRGFEGRGIEGHAEINRRLGDPSYPATPVVDEWLKHVLMGKR